MKTITITDELYQMILELKGGTANPTFHSQQCIRAIERLNTEISIMPSRSRQSAPGPYRPDLDDGTYSQRRAKFGSTCSNCGNSIEEGDMIWVTYGRPPRCNDCGDPNAKPASASQQTKPTAPAPKRTAPRK